MNKILTILFLLICTPAIASNTYYARPGGGCPVASTGGQDPGCANICNGSVNVDYSAEVTPNCAFNHYNWAIGTPSGDGAIMVGGDTLIIDGIEQIGCRQGTAHCVDNAYNLSRTAECYDAWPGGCATNPVPSGEDAAHKTKIYGAGWYEGCPTKQELWGAGWVNQIINLTDASNVDIRCLKITDHESCGYVNGGDPCSRAYNELSAKNGVYAEDSSNIEFHDVEVSGMLTGFHSARLTDWVLENVDIKYNFSAGWNGDMGHGTSSNSGDINWINSQILYNGCTDDYPNDAPGFCCSQGGGCYGDGLGTEETGGNWNFTGCNVSHNTSDGLDLLYASSGSLSIKRSKFEGNAGNQIKSGVSTLLENSIVTDNCSFFEGKDFTCTTSTCNADQTVLNCRAGDAAFVREIDNGQYTKVYNSSFTGSTDAYNHYSYIVLYDQGSSVHIADDCDGSEVFDIQNSIFDNAVAADSEDVLYYSDGCGTTKTMKNNVLDPDLYGGCPSPAETEQICNDPGLTGPLTGSNIMPAGAYLAIGSLARDAADETVPLSSAYDYNNFDKGVSWDVGALEYGSTPESPSCYTSCSLCETSGTCASSPYGCFWQLNGTCGTTIDPCNSSCLSCSSQALCEASTIPCFYWSTDQCQATEETLPGDCSTDCTLCTSANCLTTGLSCYLQLDDTCKATEDPCNTYCEDCSTYDLCTESSLGCFWNIDNHCRSAEETIQYSLKGVSLKGFSN